MYLCSLSWIRLRVYSSHPHPRQAWITASILEPWVLILISMALDSARWEGLKMTSNLNAGLVLQQIEIGHQEHCVSQGGFLPRIHE